MSENSESEPELRSILLKMVPKLRMWRKTLCELRKSNFIIHFGLSKKIEQVITITPDTKVSFYSDRGHNKFKVEKNGCEPLTFAADSTNTALLWIQSLRGQTYKTDNISIADFDIISTIGRGFYGKVILAAQKGTNELSAIKCVNKSTLIEYEKTQTIIAERNILFKANFPFITRIKFAFQDSSKFYIGMEYASGGELFRIVQCNQMLPLVAARFYISEVAVTLNYLHSLGIVYRDLKLENILIGDDGHIKLCDFGLSKELMPSSEVTRTFCGTIEYLAPEVILNRDYGTKIDWWELGILSYELIFGDAPFSGKTHKDIMEKIVNSDPWFPEGTPNEIRSFISILLIKDPNERPSFDGIKDHPFWGDIKWQDVMEKKLLPPFIPDSDGKDYTENFDPEFTTEPLTFDSLSTTDSDCSNYIPGFSLSEDIQFRNEHGIDAQAPSSLLTFELIEP